MSRLTLPGNQSGLTSAAPVLHGDPFSRPAAEATRIEPPGRQAPAIRCQRTADPVPHRSSTVWVFKPRIHASDPHPFSPRMARVTGRDCASHRGAVRRSITRDTATAMNAHNICTVVILYKYRDEEFQVAFLPATERRDCRGPGRPFPPVVRKIGPKSL